MDNPCVFSVLIKMNYAKQGCDGSVSGWGKRYLRARKSQGIIF